MELYELLIALKKTRGQLLKLSPNHPDFGRFLTAYLALYDSLVDALMAELEVANEGKKAA